MKSKLPIFTLKTSVRVVHAALAKGGAARNFLKEAERLQRYQSHSSGEAALPLETGSGTEQA